MIAGLKPYPVMKESGVEWLGKIPDHWTEKRAKYFYREADERSTTGEEELLSVSHKTGVTPRKQSVTMFMAESNVGYKICRPNDVAANTMWVFMGALGVSKQVGLVSPAYGVYRPIRPGDLLPEYVDRLLRVEGYKAEYMCRSTGINSSRLRLYPDDFLRIPIVCPPISEQAAIVRYLDHVDRRVRRLVRAKRKLIALLTEQKQAIIHRAVTRGLDPDVPLKDSGVEWLGEVPAHWVVARLKDVAVVQTGITLGKNYKDVETASFSYLRVANVQTGRLELSQVKRIDIPASETRGATLRSGDVLMTEGGDIDKLGRGCVWRGEIAECLHQNHVFAVRCRLDRLMPEFLVALMASGHGRSYFQLTAKQTTNLASTNSTTLRGFPVALPSLAEQQSIVRRIGKTSESIDKGLGDATREIDLLSEYRTRLTADVVTGKLDVREAAAKLPEVDPLAAEDWPDSVDAESETDPEELQAIAEESEA